MDRSGKQKLVSELQETLSDAQLVVITQQSGLTVAEVSDLRRKMRAAGAGFKVAKNRLAQLALKGTKYEDLEQAAEGSDGDRVFVGSDCSRQGRRHFRQKQREAHHRRRLDGHRRDGRRTRSRPWPRSPASTSFAPSWSACCRPPRPVSRRSCRHPPVSWLVSLALMPRRVKPDNGRSRADRSSNPLSRN